MRNNPPSIKMKHGLYIEQEWDSDCIVILKHGNHCITVQADPEPTRFYYHLTEHIKSALHGVETLAGDDPVQESLLHLSQIGEAHPFVIPAYLLEMFENTDGYKTDELRPPFGRIVFPVRFAYLYSGDDEVKSVKFLYPYVDFPKFYGGEIPDVDAIRRREHCFKTTIWVSSTVSENGSYEEMGSHTYINAAPGETPPNNYFYSRKKKISSPLPFICDWTLDHLWRNLCLAFYNKSFESRSVHFGKAEKRSIQIKGCPIPREWSYIDLTPRLRRKYWQSEEPPHIGRVLPIHRNAHWVRGHWAMYHTGIGRTRDELKYKAPFIRGRGQVLRKTYFVGGRPSLVTGMARSAGGADGL